MSEPYQAVWLGDIITRATRHNQGNICITYDEAHMLLKALRAPAGGVDRAQRLLERLYDAGDSLDADAFHKWVDEEFWADLEEYTNAALSPEQECHI